MKYSTLWLMLLSAGTGCYQPDPSVRAAQDLQRMAYDFAAHEEDQIQQFRSLRLGMSDDEVIKRLGPPATQQSINTGAEGSREVWTYRGAMSPLGTLTFVNRRLVEVKSE